MFATNDSSQTNLTEPKECIPIVNSKNVPVEDRKKMLRKVVHNLFRFVKHLKKKAQKTRKKDHVVHEIRVRLYKIMKNLVWEKYEHNVCETETAQKLHRLIDICKDHPERPIHCFEMYTKHFVSYLLEGLLRKLVRVPGVGRLFDDHLVEELFLRYELLLTVVSCLTELTESEEFLKQEFADWEVILGELRDELKLFKSLEPKLMRDDPVLARSVQTLNTGKTLVNFGFHLVQKVYHMGEIDDEEKMILCKALDRVTAKLRGIYKFVRRNHQRQCKRNGVKSEDRGIQKSDNREEELFKRKMSLIFRFMRNVSKEDAEKFHRQIESLTKHNDSKKIEFDSNHPTGIFFVKSGIFEIRSKTNRLIGHLSKGDVFGGIQLIRGDVQMVAVSKSESRVYLAPVALVHELMVKYPVMEKKIYKQAVFHYLKACPSRLLSTKSRYFRRLRKFSPEYLKPLLKKGKIISFRQKEELLRYVCYFQYTTMGVFVLQGSFRFRKEETFAKSIQELVTLSTVKSIGKLENAEESNQKKKSPLPKRGSKNLNPDQMKEIQDNLEILMEEKHLDHKQHQITECSAGDAAEIHSVNLTEFKILSEEIVLFLVEVKTRGFDKILEERGSAQTDVSIDEIRRRKQTINKRSQY